MKNQIIENLKTLIQVPDLASKKYIYQQYDSQVMNDTIYTGGDAAIVRVHGTNKALAISTDCTPRYVEADPFEGAVQAVAETYRNISAVGGKPLAITNCLNFGNPQKPEIMGQIVRAIKGITHACKELDYPVVSGNVSLYNETDGSAIQPTPAIGGVGLLKDLNKRCSMKFKSVDEEIFVIGKNAAHIDCSLFQREILKIENKKNPPKVDLSEEKRNSQFVRDLIDQDLISACHDISDGGLLVAIFEMCSQKLGAKINISNLLAENSVDENHLLFGEDQSRYIICTHSNNSSELQKLAKKFDVKIYNIGKVAKEKLEITSSPDLESCGANTDELIRLNENFLKNRLA